MNSRFEVFLEPEALSINRARLQHLASLGLDLCRKRVLEVGAGIGLHTAFFEQLECDVLSTDGAPDNVAEMLRRWPHRRLGVLDLDHPTDLAGLGTFDVVFCYGTLYHLCDPDGALARLASVCNGIILLETVVSRGAHPELHLVTEPPVANQAVSGVGCRPTRAWVMAALCRHFGYAYATVDQPDYPDFVTDWNLIAHQGNLRAVFVGSRQPLSLPAIVPALPMRHRNAPLHKQRARPARVWIDVGAHHGEHSLSAARDDPTLIVHAFEPLPELCAELSEGPAGYHVHPSAVGSHDGVVAFRVNRFTAASSLLPMDEEARAAWKDGHLLHEERIIQVPITRLDSFMRREGIERVDFLKIDAQGADFAVLCSAGERLADIRRIQLEVAVTPRQLYAGAANKATIISYLTERGFHLVETQVQSHSQEENLTFEHAPLASRDPLAEMHKPQSATETGIYDLAQVVTAHGEARHEGSELAIVTDQEQWAYAAVVPLRVVEGQETGRFSVALAVRVDAGAVQIGVLNREESDFPAAVMASTSPYWQDITLLTPPLYRAGPLVIRNASDAGASVVRCRSLAVIPVPGPMPEQEEVVTSAPEEACFHANQLLASADALGSMEPAAASAVARELDQAFARFRTLLVRTGMAVVFLQRSELMSIFASLDEPWLRHLASALAILAPLRPIPGWKFDSFLGAKDLATFVRYALWLSLSDHRSAEPLAVPWHAGTRLLLHMGNDLSQVVFVGGCLEPNEFALLEQVLKPGMTVIDGGANEGAYTIYAAARVGAAGRVIAVEPSPRELERLHANLVMNHADNVTVVAAALAESPGELQLRIAQEEHAGQNTLGGFMYPDVATAGQVTVSVTTLDALVEEFQLARVDVVKLDLEGAEERALVGARRVLREFRPLLLLEAAEQGLIQQGGSTASVCALLVEEGYKVLRFDPSTGELTPMSGGLSRSDSLIALHRDRASLLGADRQDVV